MKLLNALFLAAVTFQGGVAAAGTLAGDTIDVSMNRTVDTGYGTGRIFGFGLEGPYTVVDGIADRQQYSGVFTIDVDGSSFMVQFLTMGGWQDGIVLRLAGLDFTPMSGYELTNLTINSNLVGYSLVTGTNFIDIGLGGTQFQPSTFLTGSFGVAPAPEPGTAALFGLAMASFGLLRARRRRPLGEPSDSLAETGNARPVK